MLLFALNAGSEPGSAIADRLGRSLAAHAERYVHMEAGHAARNAYLQAAALELGTVVVGAFEDARAAEVLELPAGLAPLALLPVGVPR